MSGDRFLEGLERWWPLLRDVVSFTVGAAIILWQTVEVTTAQPILVGFGAASMGITGVGRLQEWLRRKE
jgi:hypothetical protein